MWMVYSIFNRRCDKKLKLGQKCSFICIGRFSVFMLLIQSAPRKGQFIFVFIIIPTVGKKQCSYCVIGRHKSWGCELANPVTHHNGCYVWQRNSQERALCYTWDLWQRGDIYLSGWQTDHLAEIRKYLSVCKLWLESLEKLSNYLKFNRVFWNLNNRVNTKTELPDLFLILWGLVTFSLSNEQQTPV